MDSFDYMGLPRSATASEAKARFNELAKLAHPDHEGGSQEKFMELRSHYEVVKTLVPSVSKICDKCSGSGRVETARGFSRISRSCHTCKGSGYVTEDL